MKEAALLRYTRLKKLEKLFINYIIKSARAGAYGFRLRNPFSNP